MSEKFAEKRNVTASQAKKILKENGVEISEKDAEKLLDFMYFLGKLTVSQYIKGNTRKGE